MKTIETPEFEEKTFVRPKIIEAYIRDKFSGEEHRFITMNYDKMLAVFPSRGFGIRGLRIYLKLTKSNLFFQRHYKECGYDKLGFRINLIY